MGISLKGFDAHARALATRIMGIGAATFLAVMAALAVYIVFRVHRPVSELRDAAMKIAMGDYSRTLDGKRGDEIGECAWAFNIMRDQIRRRTQELSRSREEYKRLFEQVPCYICVINRDLEIVRQNSSMRELFKGGVGMRCHQVFKKRSTKCEDCNLDVTFNEGRSTGQEHCGLKGSGEEANYISYATPVVNDNGEVVSAMIIAMDIGDRVRLQKALDVSVDFQSNLIENSIHGIVATDQKGRVNIFNLAAETLFGYRADEAVGDTDLNKYFPAPFVEMMLAAQTGRSPESPRLVAQEAVITSKSGEAVPVRFSGFLLFENEKISGAVGFFQDLRMFKRLEREKAQSDRLAVVGQTVAGLAHGIKNILTGLEGGVFVVETAMEDHDEQLLARGWKMVHNNIDRVSALVRDLLSYSKERAPHYEETDPNLLAEEVCALFEVKAQEKGIVIERDFDPTAGKMFKVFMDQRGIHTCLSNLVANAIDACESDSKKVQHRIVAQTRQDDDGFLIFRIIDNGAGMAEDTKRKIFSSFYSTKGSRGTGLGLLVTSKILAEHGGYISFESEEGQGTTFTISLPTGRPEGAEDAEKGSKAKPDQATEDTLAPSDSTEKVTP
jgi:PAS domain S-box-containing protein